LATLGAATLSASAGIVSTQGTVNSGRETYTIFTTQRTATIPVYIKQTLTEPQATMRYRVYNCSDFNQRRNSYTRVLNDVGMDSMGISSGCFRIGSRRDTLDDTNGWGFGSGNTIFYIEVTF